MLILRRGNTWVPILLAFSNCLIALHADGYEPSKTYRNFCASCHGEKGDGAGKASRYLYPKARSFIDSPIQFATAANGIASEDDIRKVIRKGIPNSSMSSWKILTQQQIKELVKDVLAFQREGIKRKYLNLLTNDGTIDSPNEELLSNELKMQLEQLQFQRTTSSPKWEPPNSMAAGDADNGKSLYQSQNCHKCHGIDGRGSYGIDLIGEFGFPVFARDLVTENYKYGDTATDYMRIIRLGIPGTKMPASTTLTDGQLIDLAEYISTLRSPQSRGLTNAQRYQRAIGQTSKKP